jgi:asparagine synthase (glutamine-hydrolysing)
MSIIFGVIKAEGQSVEKRDLSNLGQSTQKYAPDGTFVYSRGNIGMGFQPYNTHQRSNLETLPLVDSRDNVISFDGRLDNYAELCHLLEVREAELSDSCIVLRAFERWGEDCFSQLIGDWALALWAHPARTLYLARDHAGTRSLYFERSNGCVLWSTYLETFFTDGRMSDLDEDFAALYLACQPTRELTPYKGIRAVPPAHYLRFRDDAVFSNTHWQSIVKDSIIYNTDVQYEEHFLYLFRQSVQRRTGPGAPILAQLSGGMDSTSIVCMSDQIRRAHNPPMKLLETVSYYDNSEPNWDEFPFFTAVEIARGKAGLHLDVSYSERTIRPRPSTESLQLWPGSDSSGSDLDARLHSSLIGCNFRCVLSGLGGDEVLGGVPTPFPELADLMVTGNLPSLSRASIEWCLANRVPLLHTLLKTLRFTYGLYFTGRSTPQKTPPWLNRQLRHRSDGSLAGGTTWSRLHCPLPSKIANGNTWWSIQETLPTRLVSTGERFEYRYPYLDRNLVEFLFSIPRRQIIEPGRRRSLMRRALKNIVPNEILERRRKAYLIRGPINLIRREHSWLATQFRNLRCLETGLVDPSNLPAALDSIAIQGDSKWMRYLMRLISLELWLSSAPIKIPPLIHKGGEQDPCQVVINRAS